MMDNIETTMVSGVEMDGGRCRRVPKMQGLETCMAHAIIPMASKIVKMGSRVSM